VCQAALSIDTLTEPGCHREADCQPDQQADPGHGGHPRPDAQPQRRHDALRHRAGPGDPAAAAPPRLPGQDDQADRHQHERQRAGRGYFGRQLQVREDLRSEGLVAEHLEGAVLSQQHERHQQAPAQDGAPGLAERDAEEGTYPADSETPGYFLLTRIGGPQACCHRQVDQRVDRQRHDENGAAEALHPDEQRAPAEADHEIGNGERHDQQDGEDAPARQVSPLDQPRRQRAENRAQHCDSHGQPHGVPQQRGGQRPEDLAGDLAPARPRRLDQQEHQRDGQQDRDHRGDREQAGRAARAPGRYLDDRGRGGGPGTGRLHRAAWHHRAASAPAGRDHLPAARRPDQLTAGRP
jgi:hypothetical protein